MEPRNLIAGAALGPDELSTIYAAFDSAWERIKGSVDGDKDRAANARTRLAHAILAVADDGMTVAGIEEAAIRVMALTYQIEG